jgi:polyribonucleotide nucleotidyltransferase
VQINPEYIGMVIGKGGETIRSLEADFDVQIDIEEDGTIHVYATSGENGEAAISAITALTKDPEVGDEFTGKVVKTLKGVVALMAIAPPEGGGHGLITQGSCMEESPKEGPRPLSPMVRWPVPKGPAPRGSHHGRRGRKGIIPVSRGAQG